MNEDGVARRQRAKLEVLDRLLDERASLLARNERQASPVVEVLADGHPRIEAGVARREQPDALTGAVKGHSRLVSQLGVGTAVGDGLLDVDGDAVVVRELRIGAREDGERR